MCDEWYIYMLTFSNINDLFNFQCPAFCRRLLKRFDLKAPTDAKKKFYSKEPPYVTSKEPPLLLRCALTMDWCSNNNNKQNQCGHKGSQGPGVEARAQDPPQPPTGRGQGTLSGNRAIPGQAQGDETGPDGQNQCGPSLSRGQSPGRGVRGRLRRGRGRRGASR